MRVQQYFLNQFPVWARPDNPVLRYMLVREGRRRSRIARYVIRLLSVGTLAALVAISYQFYNLNTPIAMSGPRESALYSVLYFPLMIAQFFSLMLALILTSNTVIREQQDETWESLKITSHGAEMLIRSRWAAVFYQMRWLLALLVFFRLIFAAQMLADLTEYQGYHLDLYVTGITPEVSIEVAVILLAALMTAGILQPLVMVGLHAAFGLFLSTLTLNRSILFLLRFFVLLLAVVIFVVSLGLGIWVLDGNNILSLQPQNQPGKWISLLAMGVAGDQSLRFMDLRTFLQSWTDVDYGVLLGGAILASVLLMAVITNVLLWWTARRASMPGHE